jgi:hypothetical protein
MATKSSKVWNKCRTIRVGDVYSVPELAELLSVKPNTLPREIRLRRLRAAKRAGRYFILGAWVLEWLRAGEIRKLAVEQQQAAG